MGECMDAYTSTKYNLWKDMFLKAFDGCAKAFLPEIKRGYTMTNVYDHMIFPYDSSDAPNWEVDHNGKIVKLPRPVHGCVCGILILDPIKRSLLSWQVLPMPLKCPVHGLHSLMNF